MPHREWSSFIHWSGTSASQISSQARARSRLNWHRAQNYVRMDIKYSQSAFSGSWVMRIGCRFRIYTLGAVLFTLFFLAAKISISFLVQISLYCNPLFDQHCFEHFQICDSAWKKGKLPQNSFQFYHQLAQGKYWFVISMWTIPMDQKLFFSSAVNISNTAVLQNCAICVCKSKSQQGNIKVWSILRILATPESFHAKNSEFVMNF